MKNDMKIWENTIYERKIRGLLCDFLITFPLSIEDIKIGIYSIFFYATISKVLLLLFLFIYFFLAQGVRSIYSD